MAELECEGGFSCGDGPQGSSAMGSAIRDAEDRRSLAEAQANGWPITIRSAPSPDREKVIERAERELSRHLSRLAKRDDWAEDDTAIGGQAAFIVGALEAEGMLAAPVAVDETKQNETKSGKAFCLDEAKLAEALLGIPSTTCAGPILSRIDAGDREDALELAKGAALRASEWLGGGER